ncbi:MAG: hypothetical protein CVV44_22190 [Spirochaetae bacterium HGW-Spirochaetae-1]|nr:MAG: hypothetical protein CVV44_22190 [Spirochaetae bacterium HGW-Spirochaetae-1]
MQLFILIVINIFMGALLYLVISLKLEKSASEFREKKLRKEMDDIIKEFNAAAERNISILENRISLMKRVMERSGDMNSLDITIGNDSDGDRENEEASFSYPGNKNSLKTLDNKQEEPSSLLQKKEMPQSAYGAIDLKKSLLKLFRNVIDMIYDKKNKLLDRFVKGSDNDGKSDRTLHRRKATGVADRDINHSDTLIEKDFTTMQESLSRKGKLIDTVDVGGTPDAIMACDGEEADAELNEEEVLRLFSETKDRYGLIDELFDKGYSMEKISLLSGMPVGEIKLVLNLRKTL